MRSTLAQDANRDRGTCRDAPPPTPPYIRNAQGWRTKKTYNNGISALRCAFEFGFKNFPDRKNPAEGLDTFRIKKKDLPPVDPFNVMEAEAIIQGVHEEWGEAIGNFDEFRLFTGLRQSEQIALKTSDYDPRKGTLLVLRGVVIGVDRDRTKTSEDRIVELCPRARSVLDRQLQLRDAHRRAGKLDHDFIFFKTDGDPIRALDYVYTRWRYVPESRAIRYREPYHARHTSVTWNLMVGKNWIWVARMHGHSPEVMMKKYAKWIDQSTEEDIDAIRVALAAPARARARALSAVPAVPNDALESPRTRAAPGKTWGRLSWRKKTKDWRSGRDSNPRPPA